MTSEPTMLNSSPPQVYAKEKLNNAQQKIIQNISAIMALFSVYIFLNGCQDRIGG
jgi:hypothetical protein